MGSICMHMWVLAWVALGPANPSGAAEFALRARNPTLREPHRLVQAQRPPAGRYAAGSQARQPPAARPRQVRAEHRGRSQGHGASTAVDLRAGARDCPGCAAAVTQHRRAGAPKATGAAIHGAAGQTARAGAGTHPAGRAETRRSRTRREGSRARPAGPAHRSPLHATQAAQAARTFGPATVARRTGTGLVNGRPDRNAIVTAASAEICGSAEQGARTRGTRYHCGAPAAHRVQCGDARGGFPGDRRIESLEGSGSAGAAGVGEERVLRRPQAGAQGRRGNSIRRSARCP